MFLWGSIPTKEQALDCIRQLNRRWKRKIWRFNLLPSFQWTMPIRYVFDGTHSKWRRCRCYDYEDDDDDDDDDQRDDDDQSDDLQHDDYCIVAVIRPATNTYETDDMVDNDSCVDNGVSVIRLM